MKVVVEIEVEISNALNDRLWDDSENWDDAFAEFHALVKAAVAKQDYEVTV